MMIGTTPANGRWLAAGLAVAIVALMAWRGFAADVAPTEPPADAPADSAGVAFFEQRVRPILQANCFQCHGGERIRSDLILTRREGILTGGDHGPAVSLDDPESSLLLAMISYKDEQHQMPPAGKLAAADIATLTEWVKMGLPWPPGVDFTQAEVEHEPDLFALGKDHWAFQPVARPAVPGVADEAWVTNDIDAFILAKLESNGLAPAPRADKVTLIRRAYYDLLGLPPTPEQIEAFVNDTAPDAWPRLIDELLASPHYGEKWGRFWLDLVRFAETNSYERDDPKPHAWRYRDYVIRAFNEDKPYDEFIREQLAGDELADADSDALIATGYYRLGIWDDEPADRLQAKYDMLDDVVNTTGEVFLGLTIGCARCHDHKIDPMPQTDYYKFMAFFHNINHYRNGGETDEAVIFPSEEARAEHERRTAERRAQADDVQRQILAIENDYREKVTAGGKVAHRDIDDLRYRFYRDTFEALPDFDAIKHEDEGRIESGLFDLRLRTRNRAIGFVFEGHLLVPEDGEYEFLVHSDDGAKLTVNGQVVVLHDGIHGIEPGKTGRIALTAGRAPIRLDYFQREHGLGLMVQWSGPGVAQRLLSAPDNADATRVFGVGGELKGDVAKLIEQGNGVTILGEAAVTQYRQLRKRLHDLKQPLPVDRALVVTEAGAKPPQTFVLIRGNAHATGDEVEPGYPVVFGDDAPIDFEPRAGGRTTGLRAVLADWIASPDNMLTARVMANRIWQQHFGKGIVPSASNFGLGGDRPSHPELLDWLASEFVARGWSIKQMHRLIMTSSAYQMSSAPNREAHAKDPTNALLWRFNMRRLTSEEIRDSILAVSGQLNLRMFGPSVYPPLPRAVLQSQSKPGYGWHTSNAAESARRSVYIHVKRSLRVPIIESFDFPEPDFSCAVRMTTTQPTQALGMLNGEFLNAAAQHLAHRIATEAGDDRASQVRMALRLVTGREPSEADVERGMELIEGLKKDGANDALAMKYFCLTALNLNAFVYVD